MRIKYGNANRGAERASESRARARGFALGVCIFFFFLTKRAVEGCQRRRRNRARAVSEVEVEPRGASEFQV